MKSLKKYALLSACTLLLASCGNGGSISIEETKTVTMPPGQTWNLIGAFNDLGRWHPAVARTEMSPDGSVRTLFLKGGGQVKERLIDYSDGQFYSYEILSGPLPVANYKATLAVEGNPDGPGTLITWTGDFDPAQGIASDKAEQVMRGVYRAGLDNLQ